MVNISNNELIQGNVKITFLHGDKPFKVFNSHNTATINLCEYLRDALAGKHVIAKRPGRISACIIQNKELVDVATPSSANPNPVLSRIEIDEGVYAAAIKYTFLISNLNLNAGESIQGFRLYSNDNSITEYATVDITLMENYNPEDWIVSEGVNIKVD